MIHGLTWYPPRSHEKDVPHACQQEGMLEVAKSYYEE